MKKLALLFILLCLVACSNEEGKPLEEEVTGEGKILGELTLERENLAGLIAGTKEVKLKTISLEGLKESFSKKEISEAQVLDFDPEKGILYQDISQPSLEAFNMVRVTDIKTGESKDIELGEAYRYIDASKVINGVFYFIGSNTRATADYVEIHPEGDVKRILLSDFSRIAAYSTEEGFYVNLEEQLGQNEMETSLLFMEFGGNRAQELFKETFTLGKDGLVKEGHYFTNFYGMGKSGGFQELEDFSGNVLQAKESYIFDGEAGVVYRVPFIERFSTYLAGNQDIILNLKARKPEGDIEDDRCILYKKEDKNYKAYILPGYEYSNFIREAKRLKDGNLFIHGDKYIDFLDLKTMRGKRLSLDQENLDQVFFYKDSYLSFIEKEGDKDYLYWGSIGNH